MATNFQLGFYKLIHHADELNPADIEALKARDPWLGRKALAAWREAMEKKRPKRPKPLPVVRLKKW